MISQNKRVLRHLPPPQKKFNKNDKMMIITKISLISLNKKMIIVKIIRIMIIVSNKNNENSKNKSLISFTKHERMALKKNGFEEWL